MGTLKENSNEFLEADGTGILMPEEITDDMVFFRDEETLEPEEFVQMEKEALELYERRKKAIQN